MANTPHPLDEDVVDIYVLKQGVIRHLGRDGEYCVKDRAIITEIRRLHDRISGYRTREIAADGYKRNGNTKHTRSQFRAAGDRIVSFEDARRRKNVIPFPGHDDIA